MAVIVLKKVYFYLQISQTIQVLSSILEKIKPFLLTLDQVFKKPFILAFSLLTDHLHSVGGVLETGKSGFASLLIKGSYTVKNVYNYLNSSPNADIHSFFLDLDC
jgi:hypothetical protein